MHEIYSAFTLSKHTGTNKDKIREKAVFLEYDAAAGGGRFSEMSSAVWNSITNTCGSTYDKTAEADKPDAVVEEAEPAPKKAAVGGSADEWAAAADWDASTKADDDDIWALPPLVVLDDGDSFTW